ncbi:MAG: RNA-guided endonuclease TnpB family protein [Promethearchaeia archaeon]
MGRSSGVTITVKVPIRWEIMTKRQKKRLSHITSRDTRVIKAYLGIIERYEEKLLVGKRKTRIDAGEIDKLTLRTTDRPSVPHDFKKRFPNISTNELQECRETAIAMWKVYLEREESKPLKAEGYSPCKLPRHIFKQRFKFVYTPDKEIKHWLDLRDSLDSVREGRRRHDRLVIPLSPNSYHLNRIDEGDLKSVQIVKDGNRKWWVLFKVRLHPEPVGMSENPPAVMGIDLGIKKAVCSAVLTQDGLKHVRYWTQHEKAERIEKYDDMVASLQRKMETLRTDGDSVDGVLGRLDELRNKRNDISKDYDRKLVRMLTDHILECADSYDIHVAIGRLKGIRNRARRGNGTSRAFRKMINRWSFARLTKALKHKLSMEGFPPVRVRAVSEAWTSITCHKCGNTGLRPKQSFFLCDTCGYRDNADKNAAINIAKRLITLIPSLRDEAGLGMWLSDFEGAPKARRSTRSYGKSSRPQGMPVPSDGASVADRYEQLTLESVGSDTDPAMAKTVEQPPAATEAHKAAGTRGNNVQRTEAPFWKRNHVPVMPDKAREQTVGEIPLFAGDGSHEKG